MMMETTFTPGPLTAERYCGKDDNWFIRDRVGKTIAGRGTMLSGANAMLYAAAPDLYAALERLVAEWRGADAGTLFSAVKEADAALAKARGRA
jgi:hypothetical protein